MEEKLDKLIDVVDNMQNSMQTMQNSIETIQNTIGIMQNDIENMQITIGKMQNDIGTMQNDINDLKHTVCIIEEDHGKKLQILLDRDSDHVRKHVGYAFQLSKLEKTLEKHDARIYNLEHPV